MDFSIPDRLKTMRDDALPPEARVLGQQSLIPSDVNDDKQIELKVILLYFIDRIAMPVSREHIESFALEEDFMNVYLVTRYLKEMSDIGYLEALPDDEGSALYTITDEGQTALEVCLMSIPESSRRRITRYVGDHRARIKNEYAVSAVPFEDYDDGEHRVKCCVQEDERILLELQISVVTKDQALYICNNWKNNAATIYGKILDALMTRE